MEKGLANKSILNTYVQERRSVAEQVRDTRLPYGILVTLLNISQLT
jgi:hypothetical protein